MAFLFIIVDLIVFAGAATRWCYRTARRMLPQIASPPTTNLIYAVADHAFDVTAAMKSFYATERAPTVAAAGAYLRKYACVDAHSLVLYLTHRARVHVVIINMRNGSASDVPVAFGSMQIMDLLEYSTRVDLETMRLVADDVTRDDSEEIPDLPEDFEDERVVKKEPTGYIKMDTEGIDSESKIFIAQVNAQFADLHANQLADLHAN